MNANVNISCEHFIIGYAILAFYECASHFSYLIRCSRHRI